MWTSVRKFVCLCLLGFLHLSLKLSIKVKLSLYRPWQSVGCQEFEASIQGWAVCSLPGVWGFWTFCTFGTWRCQGWQPYTPADFTHVFKTYEYKMPSCIRWSLLYLYAVNCKFTFSLLWIFNYFFGYTGIELSVGMSFGPTLSLCFVTKFFSYSVSWGHTYKEVKRAFCNTYAFARNSRCPGYCCTKIL